jgi:hypothetical protein
MPELKDKPPDKPPRSGMGIIVLVSYALVLGVAIAAISIETASGAVFFALLLLAGLATAVLMPWAAGRG